MSDGTFLPSGATPWSAYNTPRLWAMVENEDDPESWRQVAALGSMAGLLNDQRKRLELARDALIRSWPPEQNVAARAFVELIDDLLFNMQKNKEIADANAGALGRIIETLRQAKAEIEPLYQAYVKKSDDWVPAWWDGAEDELDEKARQYMRNAEKTIANPGSAITPPPLYELRPDFTRTRPEGQDPVLLGRAGGGAGLGSGGRIGSGDGFEVPHEPPPALPGRDPSTPAGASSPVSIGPELAGVVPPAAVPGTVSPPSLPSAGPSAVPAGPGLVIGGPVPSVPRSGGSVPGGRFGAGSPGLPSGVRNGASGPGSPVGKPVPPSWLPAAPGQPARGGSTPGRPGAGVPAMPLSGGRRSSDERDSDRTFDPDNPWATAEGVDPVIEPSRRVHRHDPGAVVIGRLR